jgi:hypothetical protein
MTFKNFFLLACFASFIQSSSQQAQAITEQQANIASYIVGAGAGAATGTGIFLLLERYDAQQQKETQEPVIVENDNSNLITIDNAENKDNNHHIRNLIIGAACGVVVGVVVYKISHDVIMPHFITPDAPDQKTNFCKIEIWVRHEKGGAIHEIAVPNELMLPCDFIAVREWIKKNHPDLSAFDYIELKDGSKLFCPSLSSGS